MSVLPQLRESLVRAAERAADDGAPAPGRAQAGWRSAARTVPTLVAVGVALTVGFITIVSLHHAAAPKRPGIAAVSRTDQALMDILGVLRRPQTATDRVAIEHAFGSGGPGPGPGPHFGPYDVIPATVRVAMVTPWGQLAIVGLTKPGGLPAGSPLTGRRIQIAIGDGGLLFGVFNRHGGGGGGCCADAAGISTRGALSTGGAGRAFAGGSARTDLTLVVPDGVAKVTFLLPRQSAGNQYGAPVYRSPLRITVPVVGNVAAVRIERQCCTGAMAMIWWASDGSVVKRIGNFRGLDRVRPQPKPGPETPLSRAAEKNPSTPNPVWITPAFGEPHTQFRIHFRALLNGADYSWRVASPHCQSFSHRGGGEGDPNLLRGQIAAFDLRSISYEALCPGTYGVSVSVLDLGRFGGSVRNAKPFGTATFTVR